MQTLAILLFWSLSHPLISLLALILSLIILLFTGITFSVLLFPKQQGVVSKGTGWLALFLAVAWFFNPFVGHFLRNPIVYRFGAKAEAIVTAITPTSNTYNDERVMRYEVLLKPNGVGASPITTYFESSDFNIHPHFDSDGYAYPRAGLRFSARYLPGYPRALVISDADDSEYLRSLQASQRASNISRLRHQLSLARENQGFRLELAAALEDDLIHQSTDQSSAPAAIQDALRQEIRELRK